MKKRQRKLRLNRQTLRHLDATHLQQVAGGDETAIPWQCETGPETGPVSACDDTNPGGDPIPTAPFPFTTPGTTGC